MNIQAEAQKLKDQSRDRQIKPIKGLINLLKKARKNEDNRTGTETEILMTLIYKLEPWSFSDDEAQTERNDGGEDATDEK
jgi:hypothetical protein